MRLSYLPYVAAAIAACFFWSEATYGRDRTDSAAGRADEADYHPELGASFDGTRVIALLPGSPAARAGLQVGDEIRQIGSEPVGSSDEVRSKIAAQRPDTVTLIKIDRDHRPLSLKMWVGPNEAHLRAIRSARAREQATTYRSNYRPAEDPRARTRVPSPEVNGSLADEDYVNSGLDSARRRVDPNSDILTRSRRGERELDRAQRAFDRNTNRLAEKAGSPQEFDQPLTPEPPGYHVVGPGDVSGPRMSQSDRGPLQYLGRPGASQSERGDYPLEGDKGGISHDRRQATASDALTPDRAGRTSAEDRTTRLVDEFSTHIDRQNGRPDRLTGENDSRVHPQRPYTRPAASGRPWRPDASGGGSAFPVRPSDRGINPANEGTNLRYPRSSYGDLNYEETDPAPRRSRYDD